MLYSDTALVLIGYQNDYFAEDGILHGVIEDSILREDIVGNTVHVLSELCPTPAAVITTPIIFTPGYEELVDPVGILKAIKDSGAFMMGTKGSETIPEFSEFKDRIVEIPGKRGLNAFSNTELGTTLVGRKINNVVLAGAVTSICIDSTAREAFERGYRVTILSDCVSGRTQMEQKFYCENIFPLYADVMKHDQFLDAIN